MPERAERSERASHEDGFASRTFRSLRVANYRRFFLGMAVSATGQWLQLVAQGWLVLKLTGSGVALGTVTALQFLPILIGGAHGGVVADGFDKRRVLVVTQSCAAVLALVLGLATAAGRASIGLVYAMAFGLGCVNAVDNPTRRSFLSELVPVEDVANAVSLNTAVMTSARIVGPALAGLLIGRAGLASCFLLNAASFAAVLVALWRIAPEELHGARPQAPTPGMVRVGLRYAMGEPTVRLTLLMIGIISTAAFNYQVVMPLFAERVFGGDATTYGLLLSCTSVGSLAGSLFTASRVRITLRFVIAAAFAFGVTMTAAALAPSLHTAYALVVPMGASGAAFVSAASGLLQMATAAEFRGRVMALWAVVFLGSTPIGGPLVGAASEAFGARSGLLIGGATSVVVAAVVAVARARRGAGFSRPPATPT